MPTRIFHELDKEKKQKIINTGISEFAQHGYLNSSTNRIVKDSEISKGSLFQYFNSKEELYFYILDCIFSEFNETLGNRITGLSNDLFKRMIDYSQHEFAWYIQNPDKYKIVTSAFMKSDTEIYQKVTERYNITADSVYYSLMEGIDTSMFKWDKQKTVDVLKWFLFGFNNEFINKAMKECADIEQLKNDYVICLIEYTEILKIGLLR